MAADIHRHFKSLRAQGRRRGRADPFATGFEDEFDHSRTASTTKGAIAVNHKPADNDDEKRRSSSPYVRVVHDSDDDNFLSYRPKRNNNIDRRASPTPSQVTAPSIIPQPKTSRGSRALAVGNLAYLDDSEEEEDKPTQHRHRRPSPAPGKQSPDSDSPRRSDHRSLTPLSTTVPQHTVASAFAGTKYLQDSDSDEEAVVSRSNSQDSTADTTRDPTDSLSPLYSPREVKREEKRKASGSGVSWRAFSAGRTEQRNTELQALRDGLQKRGKSISFVTHVVTDDGQRIPLGTCCSGGKSLRGRGRERSPPRTAKDVEPSGDEITEQPHFTTNPFSGQPLRPRSNTNPDAHAPSLVDTERRPSSAGELPDIRVTAPVGDD